MPKVVPVCSIAGCYNSIESKVKSTKFYFVPTDHSRATNWAKILKDFIGDTPILQALICINHFKKEDFERNSNKLKEAAIPSIFSEATNDKTEEPSRKNMKIANVTRVLKQNKHEGEISDDEDDDRLLEHIKQLKAMKQSLAKHHQETLEQDNILSEELALTETAIYKKKKELKSLPEGGLEVLKKCFSAAQIRHLIGKSKTKWSLDDVAMAYTISSLTSRDFSLYLRKELKFPLPSASNVNRCYRNMERATKAKIRRQQIDNMDLDNDK